MAHGHHIIPKAVLYKVFGGLVALTIITVLTAQVDLGVLNVPLALVLASGKALLVVTFFMGLKYDSKVNTLAFVMSIVFVMIFLIFTLFDTAFRGDMSNVYDETVADMERREERLRAAEPDPQTQRVPMGAFEQDSLATPRPGLDAASTPDEEGAGEAGAAADTSAAAAADTTAADTTAAGQ